MIVRRMVRALDSRLRFAPLARRGLAKVFPDHWSFMLGEIALYAFVVLVLTGVFLTLFFEPSVAETTYHGRYQPLDGQRTSAAYASSIALSFDVRAGLLMRQTHHWAALVFIGGIVLHLLRVFFTGAFRKPREINWLVGVTMLTLALLNGFSGYSIPDDLLSGIGLRIAYSVVESIPLVGGWLAFGVFGGEFPAQQTIPRLYLSHVLLVPALLATLIAVHMAILVRQKHSQFPGPGRTEHNVVGSRLWPSYTLRTLGLLGYLLAVLFALGGLVQINPVWIYGPFEPAAATSPAQPDWFVAWEEGALRLFPPADLRVFGHFVPAMFFPGVVLGGLTFLALYAWPFVEARRSRDRRAHQLLDRPREHPVRLALGVAAIAFYALLTATAADDILARFLRVPVMSVLSVMRVLVLTVPWVVGLVAYLLARSLRLSAASGLTALTVADLRAAVRRRPRAERGEPAVPPAPPAPSQAAPVDEPDAPPAVPGRRIEAWAAAGRTWRWRYVDEGEDGEPVSLTSNVAVDTEDEASRAGRTAYPGVPVTRVVLADPRRTDPAEPTAGQIRAVHRVLAVLWVPIVYVLRHRLKRRRPGGSGKA